MKISTAMSAAFKRAGLKDWKPAFQSAIALAVEQASQRGASYTEISDELLVIANRLPSGGHSAYATGRGALANARQPNRAQSSQNIAADPGPTPSSVPAREPTRTALAAASVVAKKSATVVKLTIGQRYRFGDGRPMMQVKLSELLHYATVGKRDAYIAQKIYERCRGLDQNLCVGQAVNNQKWLDNLVERAQKEQIYAPR